jgi:hypothetical protein
MLHCFAFIVHNHLVLLLLHLKLVHPPCIATHFKVADRQCVVLSSACCCTSKQVSECLRYDTTQLHFVGTAAATTARAAAAAAVACCSTQHSVRLAVLAGASRSQQLQAVRHLIGIALQAGKQRRCWCDN